MILPRMIMKNAFRRKVRTILTIVAMGIAILAFGLLRTVLTAWYSAVDASSATRLVTRNAVSIIFPLPLAYHEKIRHVSGVHRVSHGSWFGGIYISEKNFFASFAVDPESYLDLFPELVIPGQQKADFFRDRRGFVAGRKLADRFGWRVGDVVTLKGTIYPGDWDFVLRGIYEGRYRTVDETQFFFHWDYLNEGVRRTYSSMADQVGFFMIGVKDPNLSAEVAREIDAMFANSRAETLTETERAFIMGFISMSEAIVMVIRIVSLVIIVIILAVVANTMAMTTRERVGEYAVLKTLGYSGWHIGTLISGEAFLITLSGCLLGIAMTYPVVRFFTTELGAYFPVFFVEPLTIWLDFGAATLVGATAAVIPTRQAVRIRIADGLRRIG
ncbi:MAG TPA: FtsX-like permease family protein [Deltaproteobacteria bacterium]|jgi:putative ABC transport system permease protein|nr:FtsX-like permease family protein [Deltaproteobacteria bacterium]NMD40688.1 FtsX-like permease family protein [Deltaproteobacteria bacterium]HNQ86469.1 FtsX-like permease family protein [Deltaproteobacteria bacterium]HNS90199.1 FtsX-like permease family protein [Deltaproteobacteria bacterium]HOA45005.1 FtsX-like permease family protein [Deltaproteobacteria bacterium]